MIKRIKLLIEYDGTDYVGWQKQKNGKSIQEEIEICLRELFQQEVSIHVAGRTDAGVHAFGQVAHFDINKKFDIKRLNLALNNFLKKRKNKITILKCKKVSDSFHARFSAKKKIYLYKILNRSTNSHLLEKRVWFFPSNLNITAMRESSLPLVGNHDFSAFRSTDCQAKKTIRSIDSIRISKRKDLVEIRVRGKSFLHNQVRIIVGTLVRVGNGFWNTRKIKEIINSKDRKNAGPTAPPEGLYLEKIFY